MICVGPTRSRAGARIGGGTEIVQSVWLKLIKYFRNAPGISPESWTAEKNHWQLPVILADQILARSRRVSVSLDARGEFLRVGPS